MKLLHLLHAIRKLSCKALLFVPVLTDAVQFWMRGVLHDQFPVAVTYCFGKCKDAMRILFTLQAAKHRDKTHSCQRDDVPPLEF